MSVGKQKLRFGNSLNAGNFVAIVQLSMIGYSTIANVHKPNVVTLLSNWMTFNIYTY